MKTSTLQKLALHRETLRSLSAAEAARILGGRPSAYTAGDVCTLGCALTDYCPP